MKSACEALGRTDPALAKAYEICGLPIWRDRPVAYETIATTIAYQQISVKAAAAIWARVKDAFGEITPQAITGASEEALRGCGLSRPKIKHMTSVAEACLTGELDLNRLIAAPSDAARDELLRVKGIGPWTAELFLLYARGEMDAFPTADLGLMEAHKRLSDAENRMTKDEFTSHAERWKPWRGVAAHLLWAWLHHDRSGDATPA
ncbi:MAG: DNA-3-methyladenine glycosylase 2 family protein [Pseudomonadota bacterium]